MKRQDAKIAKGFIVGNKSLLGAFAIFAVQNTRGKFHSLNGPAAAGGGANLKLHLGDVELKRQDAKIAKGFIVENKRFLSAFASLRFKTLVASFTL